MHLQGKRDRRRGFDPWVGKIPSRRNWQPTPGFLPGESHRQRSLAGYGPRDLKESDMTERLSMCANLYPLNPWLWVDSWCHTEYNLAQFSSVQWLSRVWLFATPWAAARQASLSITNSQSLHKVMSIESVMPSNRLLTYWAPTDLGSSSFSVISFCLFMLLMGFSRQEYWSGLPLPSPVDHILSELFTTTFASWVTLHSMGHSLIELDRGVVSVISLFSFLWLWFSFCLPSEG